MMLSVRVAAEAEAEAEAVGTMPVRWQPGTESLLRLGKRARTKLAQRVEE